MYTERLREIYGKAIREVYKRYKTFAIDYGALDLDYGSSTCGFMDLFLYINQPKSTLPLKGFDVNTGSLLRLLRYDHADN